MLMSGTGSGDLLDAIRAALETGDPQAVLTALEALLSDARAEQIAVSEVTRAWNAGALLVMKALGLAYVRWQTRNDAKVCAILQDEPGREPGPVSTRCSQVRAKSPPQHPNCRVRSAARAAAR